MNKKVPRNIKELKEILKNPPDEYGIAPFWFLNGNLNEKELLRQLKEKLFRQEKFINYEFFQNKINKGICFFRNDRNSYYLRR